MYNKPFCYERTGSVKMTAFWDIAPCKLVEVDRRFAPIIRVIMGTVRTSETSALYDSYITKTVIFILTVVRT
jgi:hypothetical protein